MTVPGSTLTFLPHLVRELPVDATLVGSRLQVDIEIRLLSENRTERARVLKTIKLRGPGDILDITSDAIARVEPPDGSHDFEPNYFSFVIFRDPGFLWRYSLDPSGTAPRVRPWLSLILLTAQEIEGMARDGIEVFTPLPQGRELLSVRADLLPALDDAWALAHVQLNNRPPEQPLSEFLSSNPAAHCSRLFCARALTPETHYFAFVVPNYRAALDAALGTAESTAGTSDAWSTASSADVIQLPVLHRYSFMTSEHGDFEELTRNLVPSPVDAVRVGMRAVDAALMLPAPNPDALTTFLREGTVVPPGYSDARASFATASQPLPLTEPLRELLNESLETDPEAARTAPGAPDPLITFPAYGRYYRRVARLNLPAGENWPAEAPWMHEANLDFRHRVVEGLAASVVRRDQDKLVKECWEQVGKLRSANELLRRAKIALDVGKTLERKHLRPLSDERFTMLTRPFHTRVATTDTGPGTSFRKRFAGSGLVEGSLSQAFRRLAYSRIGAAQVRPFAVWDKARCGCACTPRQRRTMPDLRARAKLLGLDPSKLPEAVRPPKAEIIPVSPVDLGREYRPRVDLGVSLRRRVGGLIRFNDGRTVSPAFEPIIAAPSLDHPMYRALADLSVDYVLPGVEFLLNNGITLMEEHRRTIEAYALAMNHELVGELTWRHFPVSKRATICRFFWDPTQPDNPPPDIKDIHTWRAELGENKAGVQSANLVLVVKGDLIRRYPGTIIYCVRIKSQAGGRFQYLSEAFPDDSVPPGDLATDKTEIIQPVFRAQLSTDIQLAGFPFSLGNVQGATRNGEYYFILQENQDLPRFGLDVQSVTTRARDRCGSLTAATSDNPCPGPDLSWTDFGVDPASGYLNEFDDPKFGANATAALIACRTYQKPMRVAIHSSLMLARPT